MIRSITFDCYDTLVRYSEGKVAALRTLAGAKGGNDGTANATIAAFETAGR